MRTSARNTFAIIAIMLFALAIPATATTLSAWEATSVAPITLYALGAAGTRGANNSEFVTTLNVTNLGPLPTTVTVGLIPRGGTAAVSPVSFTLASGESKQIEKVLSTLFGIGDGSAGTLVLTASAPLKAWIVTSNIADPKGSYGLLLPAVRSTDVLAAGDTAETIYVSQSSDLSRGFRTNVNVALLEANSDVEVRVLNQNGALLKSASVSGGPLTIQWSVRDIIGADVDLEVGRIQFVVKSGKAAGFTVVNDNVTSDAIAFLAERVVPGSTDLVVSGVAKTFGANGTYWSSDLRLYNTTTSEVEVTLDALVGQVVAPVRVVVGAKSVHVINNVVDSFGLPTGTGGAVRIMANAPIMVAGRTFNSDPNGVVPGTFSAQLNPIRSLLQAGSTGYLTGVSNVSGQTSFRTNLAILAGAAGANGNLILRDQLGTQIATSPFDRTPYQWGQLNTSTQFGGITVPENARIDVVLSSGSASAYTSRVDNGTGDGSVQLADVAPTVELPTLTFTGPDSTCANGTVTVNYMASDPASTVSIDGHGTSLPASGSIQVLVGSTTVTLTGRATNVAGTGPDASTSIASIAAPTSTLHATEEVELGQSVVAEWTVTGELTSQSLVDSLEGEINLDSLSTRSATIAMSRTGVHMLTHTANTVCGQSVSTVWYTVVEPCDPPTISSFTATPSTIIGGNTSTLKFTIANATSWTLSSSLGNSFAPGVGTGSGAITASYNADNATGTDTVTLTVVGLCGTTSGTVHITVN